MKLSQYIEQLQNLVSDHGDLDCVHWIENSDWDSSTEGWHELVSPEDIAGDLAKKIKTSCTYISDGTGVKQYCSTNAKGYIECKNELVFEMGYKQE